MPSKSAAQHRFIGYLNSNPEAQKASGMSKDKVREWLHADKGSPWKRDEGGSVPEDGGIGNAPPTAQTQNPNIQGQAERYDQESTESLMEMAQRLRGSQQGQVIQNLLLRRQMQPQLDPATKKQQQAAPQIPQQQQQPAAISPISAPLAPSLSQPFRKGGTVKRADGGMMSASEASPWWTRREAESGGSGLLHGATPGRADQIKTQAPPGAYVIPADVIAGLGQGNNLAGAKAMQEYLNTGPWGTPLPRGGRGHTIPRAPASPTGHTSADGEFAAGGGVPIFEAKQRSKGGPNLGDSPVDLSDGEFVVHPSDCDRFGRGDRTRGHRHFDRFVKQKRKEQIRTLQNLPGPVVP